MYSLNKTRSVDTFSVTTIQSQLSHLTVRFDALEAEYHRVELEKKEYEKEIEELKQKIESLVQENKTYIEIMNLEQQKKPALSVQISSMTTSLDAINSEKDELQTKLIEYAELIKKLSTECYEIKETNEKYVIALENDNKQKQSMTQLHDEANEYNFNRIIHLETENEGLRDELNVIKNKILMNESEEKSRDVQIQINQNNSNISYISKPSIFFPSTPITPNKHRKVSVISSSVDDLMMTIPQNPNSPPLNRPQFINNASTQSMLDQYTQLTRNISSVSQDTFPYLMEQEENDKMDEHKTKIECLNNELTDCYTEIAELKENINNVQRENDALLSNEMIKKIKKNITRKEDGYNSYDGIDNKKYNELRKEIIDLKNDNKRLKIRLKNAWEFCITPTWFTSDNID